MIIVKPVKNSKGFRLEVRNANGNIFNHDYNKKHDTKRAWKEFEKQVKLGKVKFEY